MKLYVDNDNCIRAVGSTDNPSLTELIVDETAENFPFKGMSTARICCYKVNVSDGVVTMYTPYRPSSALEYIDEVGHEADDNADKAQAFDIMIGGAE